MAQLAITRLLFSPEYAITGQLDTDPLNSPLASPSAIDIRQKKRMQSINFFSALGQNL
jgi:hypothetical protein